MKVLITGANGFVGKNLQAVFIERKDIEVLAIGRDSSSNDLKQAVEQADFIFHLAGVNRPVNPEEFSEGNTQFTQTLCELVKATGKKTPIIYTSSIQAERENPYGVSKRGAEEQLLALQADAQVPVYIFRLPNIFGKWCKPNYNSAVATFCYNTINDLPLTVNDPSASVTLVYIDDVVGCFVQIMDGIIKADTYPQIEPTYTATVGELVSQIQAFRECRTSLISEKVGEGLVRALYSTYVSYLTPEQFSYGVPKYGDPRGVFVEMLKTKDSGQFSFFTAHPGITRGGHYHHSKTEKFLVIKGEASFRFRHILTDETFEQKTSGDNPVIVETVPGWSHDITNIGDSEMIVMLWANEIFDRNRPDTYAHKV
ncbi:MAG: SDR family oxidoreductase [Moraxellaceae bacterium]|nr:SDR family oxidoreductase [Moraxellaceae bacterium]MCP5177545.1 SDR family oxidoreductase [Moraxellaceae bacterium]